MALKFCANLGFLFIDNSKVLLERYGFAANAGFKGVEGPFPEESTLEELREALTKNGIEQVLLNIKLGRVVNGNFGCASFPNTVEEFRRNFDETLSFAKALNIKKIHVMAGKLDGESTHQNDETYVNNLKYVASKLENENIIAVIEPINSYSVPGYYMNCYLKAIQVLNTVNSPKVKMMLDLFHLQLIKGNITNTIKELIDYVGHVQIAQAPHRYEPNTVGEVNYPYVLKILEEAGYVDWIGCEYKPRNGTTDGLGWIQEYGYKF